MPWLVVLSLALSPDVPILARQLGDSHFKTRESAERQLAARMTWPMSLRLELLKPVNAEAACRLDRIIKRYWIDAYPAPERMPFIDSLSWPNCRGCNNALSRHYYARRTVSAGGTWPEFRAGTVAMIAELTRWRIPPAIVQPILGAMDQRSKQWESGRRGPMESP